jgi:aminoglycoside phosphotransferase (APT) family kinase protein
VRPPAEIEADDALVRTLLLGQHPDLAHLPLQRIDAGWDNVLWRLGEELIVRLPRRLTAVALTLKEQRWLPVLADQLPLPVPRPVRVGRPSRDFPWPWSVVPFLPGEPGDVCPLTDGPDAARQLATFLRALHVPTPPDAPLNLLRGSAPLATRSADFERLVAAVDTEIEPAPLRAIWKAGLASSGAQGPRVWLHADLHPANTLGDRGTLVGILDFGDMCAGDRANDLAAAWILLPGGAAEAFFDAYGVVDRDTELRARAWAVLLALMLLGIGLAGQRGDPGGKPTWAAPARAALQRLTA